MQRLLILIALSVLTFTSQSQTKTKDKLEYVKQYNYRIELVTTYGYTGYERHYIIDNSQINSDNSFTVPSWSLKPLTLYSIAYDRSKEKPDTAEVNFPKSECDTLFNLTRSFFKAFQINNIDTVVNGVSKRTQDFGHWAGQVIFEFEGRVLSAKIKDIENEYISTAEFEKLRKYISKFFKLARE